MRVVVIGATGRLGKRITRGLVARNHDVVGVNRRPGRVPEVLPDLELRTVAADAADVSTMTHTVAEADAVVLVTAPAREDPWHYPDQARSVLAAVRKSGGARLVAVTGHAALRAPDGRPMLEAHPPHPYFHDIEAAQVAFAETIASATDVDWLLVAAPAELYPYGEVTGRWIVGRDALLVSEPRLPHPESSRMSMEDFADFVAGEVDRPLHRHELLTLVEIGGRA